MGPGGLAEHHGQGGDDADPEAEFHAEGERAGEGQGQQPEVAALDGPQPAGFTYVDEAGDGHDHHRCQDGVGEWPEDWREDREGERHHPGAENAGQLCARPARGVHGRAGEGAAHRVGVREAGDRRGDAEGDELPVGIDRVAVALGEDLGDSDRLHETEHRDGQGGRQHVADVIEAGGRHADRRQPAGNIPDHAHVVILEMKGGHRQRAQADGDQRPRPAREPAAQGGQQCDPTDPDGQRGALDLVDPAGGLGHDLVDPFGVLQVDADQVLELAGADEDRRRRREAAEDRPGQEAHHEPEPSDTEGDAHQPDHDGQRGRHLDRQRRVSARELSEPGGGEKGADGGRADAELARSADGGVGDQRQHRRVQPDLGRQPGEEGVAHRLGNEHRPDGHARDEVALQIRPVVTGQPVEDRQAQPAAVTSHRLPPTRHYIATGAHAQPDRRRAPAAYQPRAQDAPRLRSSAVQPGTVPSGQ